MADKDEMGWLPVLEHTVTHIGKPAVERSREQFEVVGMPDKITHYDRLVEDAVAERVCDDEGIPKDMTARVVASKAADGVPQLHIFGRNAAAVDAVADGVRSLEREVYRHYIGNRVSPDEEAATIRPVLEDIMRNLPTPILDSPGDFIRKALSLPFRAVAAGERAIEAASNKIDEAAEALTEFNKGGKNNDTKD